MWEYEAPIETTTEGQLSVVSFTLFLDQSLEDNNIFFSSQILLSKSDVAGWGAFLKVIWTLFSS